MGRKLTSLRSMWIVVSLAAVLAIAGCSSETPFGPDTQETPDLAKQPVGVLDTRTAVLSDLNVAVDVANIVSASSGGVVAIQTSSIRHEFKVPALGIKDDVNITICYKKEILDRKVTGVFEFGPSGLVFDSPATLEFDVADINPSAKLVKLHYYDPEVEDWVLQGYSRVIDGKASFLINHFSKYAISD